MPMSNVFFPNDDSADDVRLFDWSGWRPGLPAVDLAYMMAVHWYPSAAGAWKGRCSITITRLCSPRASTATTARRSTTITA